MRPLAVMLLVGAGWYLYKDRNAKRARAAAAAATDTGLSSGPARGSMGIRPIVQNGQCVGVEHDPAWVNYEGFGEDMLANFTRAEVDVLGKDHGMPTPHQARLVLNRFLEIVFPGQCDWGSLPDQAPYGDRTIRGVAAQVLGIIQPLIPPTQSSALSALGA